MMQSHIKANSLEDFKEWVGEWAEAISEAEGRDDVKNTYKGVKVLTCKHDQPPTNLTTDADGNTLKSVEDIVST